jgi:hypothetical protein
MNKKSLKENLINADYKHLKSKIVNRQSKI